MAPWQFSESSIMHYFFQQAESLHTKNRGNMKLLAVVGDRLSDIQFSCFKQYFLSIYITLALNQFPWSL